VSTLFRIDEQLMTLAVRAADKARLLQQQVTASMDMMPTKL